MTPDPLARALVRILAAPERPPRPVGAGFLIGPNRVLTCAHVIADALDIPRDTQTRPDAPVWLDLPLLADSEPCQGHVVADADWYPINEQVRHGELEDVAILKLEKPPSADTHPIAMVAVADFRDRPVRTLGFPAGYDDGHWVSGRTKGVIGTGWVQLDNELGRHGVTPGFSGTPVWDEQEQAVIGMIVSVPRGERSVAYMIPAAPLGKLAPELNRQQPVKATGRSGYSGKTKLAFCRRLGDSWRDLATWLEIPAHDQARFERGDECRALWTWLDDRGRLDELPDALDAIGRGDLADLIRQGT